MENKQSIQSSCLKKDHNNDETQSKMQSKIKKSNIFRLLISISALLFITISVVFLKMCSNTLVNDVSFSIAICLLILAITLFGIYLHKYDINKTDDDNSWKSMPLISYIIFFIINSYALYNLQLFNKIPQIIMKECKSKVKSFIPADILNMLIFFAVFTIIVVYCIYVGIYGDYITGRFISVFIYFNFCLFLFMYLNQIYNEFEIFENATFRKIAILLTLLLYPLFVAVPFTAHYNEKAYTNGMGYFGFFLLIVSFIAIFGYSIYKYNNIFLKYGLHFIILFSLISYPFITTHYKFKEQV